MAAALYFNIESTNVIDKTDRIRKKMTDLASLPVFS